MRARGRRSPGTWRSAIAGGCLALLGTPLAAHATEGGTSHTIPGGNATLVDLPATAPGWFSKAMYLSYRGSSSAQLPTAAGLAGDLDAEASTFVLGGGYTFERTVLGGAHYTVAAFLPYGWLDVSGEVQAPLRAVSRRSKVSGLGDLAVVPAMLAWTRGDWQLDALIPIYAPTGSYEQGRLGNPGLHYWTFDPTVGVAYKNARVGFNAMLHVGYAINTENPATDYRSGGLLHVEGALEQLVPAGPGFLALGAEGFYFQQMSGDSGSGAVLGRFAGRTAGVGPLVGYVLPLGDQALSVELKWLPELDTKNRLEGDYVWLKAVFKF